MILDCCLVFDQYLVVASPENDYQEHLNHRGEQSARHRIATAQYQCFQRMLKKPHRKNKAADKEMGKYRNYEGPDLPTV